MRYRALLSGTLAVAASAHGALACGYHSGLANAAFDVAHPRSLAVAVAIRQAADRGVLDKREEPAKLALFGAGYRRAVRQLHELEDRLARVASRLDSLESRQFALVLVRSRLWTRYVIHAGDVKAVVHTAAADDSETVVLSDESVLSAVVDKQVAFDAAVEQGLVEIVNDRDGKVLGILRAALGGEV
jgi:hypothetical protein